MPNLLPDRLVMVREAGGKSQKELAEELCISKRSWQDYELGKSVPGGKVFISLAKKGFNINWLLTGEGPMRRANQGGASVASGKDATWRRRSTDAPLDEEDYALVPRYNVEVSAGHGCWPEEEGVIEKLAFKRDWLRRLGLQLEHLVLVTARGDSMEPTFYDGDLLLVDLSQTRVVDGGISVIRSDGLLLAKRLQAGFGEQVFVCSDNPRYQRLETIKENLNIVGRVVWRGGRM